MEQIHLDAVDYLDTKCHSYGERGIAQKCDALAVVRLIGYREEKGKSDPEFAVNACAMHREVILEQKDQIVDTIFSGQFDLEVIKDDLIIELIELQENGSQN